MLPDSLGYIFDATLRLDPAKAAILAGDAVLTYADLDRRCNLAANALLELGVRPGDRIALMFGNDYRFLESLFGSMRIGAVPVPLNIRMGNEALAYILDHSEAVVLITGQEHAERIPQVSAQIGHVKHIVVEGGKPEGALNYDELLAAQSGTLKRRRTEADEICMQPYTSGSTGRPKGVLLTHGGQIWNADVMRKAVHVDSSERALVCVPLYHKNAMICAVKPFLLGGGSLAILPSFDPLTVIEAIERFGVTYLTGVPAMYRMMLAETAALKKHDVSSMRYALCGSAEVPEDLLELFQTVFGATIDEIYGLTEGGPVPLVNLRWGVKRQGSCGRPFPESEVRLVDSEGSEVTSFGMAGELLVRNPGLAKGYWRQPDVTRKKIRDGWLHTGDLFRTDEDGFHYFVGRKDDMINVGGENVYPKEVEEILMRFSPVREAAVVAVPHDVKGEVPVAFVVGEKSGETSEADVKNFFLKEGAAYAHPRRVFFLSEMPLGGTGKLDRAALKARALDELKDLG